LSKTELPQFFGAQLERLIECCPSYDNEPYYEEEVEPQADFEDDAAAVNGTHLNGDDHDSETGETEDPAARRPENVVLSGDPDAAERAKQRSKAGQLGSKDKKVADEDRTTTPYMTKYERARVLGTRALQIR
jgi:RNA polymerase Rpb6